MTEPTPEERLAWIEELLNIFWVGDAHEELFWRTSDAGSKHIDFYAMCSDTFAWGCADLEPITLPDDLASLRQAKIDAYQVEREHRAEHVYVSWVILWCCRKRGMRPMNAWMNREKIHPVERALYETAGPPRESTFGAP